MSTRYVSTDLSSTTTGGVPIPPMSPEGLRGIGWLGTIFDMNDDLWWVTKRDVLRIA
eukprot:COSAG05_NODE_2927_length_2496_cov_1.884022_1_plen_56_part_10